MPDARVVARGALWNYSAQIATVFAQMGYAAATSRLLPPHDFGVFAAALGSVALINLLALAGLPQVIGRMTELHPDRLLGLLLYAVLVGVAAGAAALLTAPLWALLWGVPAAVEPIRVLAATSFLMPLVALGNGLGLRLGLFRRLAGATVVANVAGMAVGVVVVAVLRTPASLGIAQILGQLAVAVIVLALTRRHFAGRLDLRATLADIRYSSQTLVSGLLTYGSNIVGKVAVSHTLGTVPLGNWNRAEAITTTPFWLLGAAITQAVYPEFRHDLHDRTRTRRVWSDLLGVIGWITLPIGVVVSVLAPVVVQVLLGDGWALAGGYASVLAIIGAVQPVVFLLVSGFEALGRFRWNWIGFVIGLVVNVVACAVAVLQRQIWPVFIGLLAGYLAMHVLHLALAQQDRLIDLRRVLRHYAEIAVFSVALGALLWVLVHAGAVVAVSPLLLVVVLVAAAATVLRIGRRPHRFPPLVLARAYRLLPGQRGSTQQSADQVGAER